MSRPKAYVPTPDYVNPEALAHRIKLGEAHDAAEVGPPITRPVLAVDNPAPVESGLIGHPTPKLAVSNDDPIKLEGRTLLPEIDWTKPKPL